MKRILTVALVCILVMALCSCQGSEAGITPVETQDENVVSRPTLPPPVNDSPSNTARVATRLERDLNPLYPKHYATASLLRLVYEPLFDVGYDGVLTAVLAESINWSLDGLTCTITIRKDKSFHDGRQVRAGDVRACLAKYLAIQSEIFTEHDLTASASATQHKDQTILYDIKDLFYPENFSGITLYRRHCLDNIDSMSVDEQGALVIELLIPDPDFAGLLVFPVIPEDDVDTRSMNGPVGSGAWMIESSQMDGGFVVSRVIPEGRVRRLEAVAFETILEASRAYDRGELDILLMDSTEASLFADRSRIRKQRFDMPGFVSLFFSGRNEQAIENRNALLYVLQTGSSSDKLAAPLERAYYPLIAGDWRIPGSGISAPIVSELSDRFLSDAQANDYDEVGEPEPGSADRKAFTLLVPEGFIPARLVGNLRTRLLELNRQLIVVQIGREDWFAQLRNARYDAALLTDSSDLFLDPLDYLDGLDTMGIYHWWEVIDDKDIGILRDARHLIGAMDESVDVEALRQVYADSLSRVFSIVPVIGLATTATMVWYGDEVEGTMTGMWRSPYENVEELSIWRR
ncbi:MAG: hypothetical protein GX850_04865 [Clostridiaceae bacterium]|nr:hypothetical protein [Clostridiaceae bacterium]